MPASVDGDIKLSVGINTSSVKQDADKLAKSIQGVFSHYSRDSKSANANLMSLQHQMAKYSNELNKAYEEQRKLANQKLPTAEYTNTENAITKITQRLNTLNAKETQMIEVGRAVGKSQQDIQKSSSYQNLTYQIKQAVTELERYKRKLDALKSQGADKAIRGVDTAQYSEASNRVVQLQNRLAELQARYNQVGKSSTKSGINLSTSFKNAFKGITGVYNKLKQLKGNTSNTFNDMAKSAKKSFMTILKYAFSIRSIFILFKRLKAYTKEAFNAMAQSIPRVRDDLNSLSSSFGQVKNSLGTAFQPILSYAVPALNALASALVTAMNALANFFATFTGQKVIYKATKANNNLAKSYGGAGSSAKDAAEDIAEYDKLIVINQDKASGGGGGGGSADTGAGLFEEVATEPSKLAQMIKDAWKKEDFTDVGAYIGQNIKDGLESINWNKIKKTANKIGKSFATLINGVVEVKDLGKTVGTTIAEGFNTGIELASGFVKNLHWDSIGQFFGDGFNGFWKKLDTQKAGNTVYEFLKGIITTGQNFLNTADFNLMASKIATFINELNFPDLGTNAGKFIHDFIIKLCDAAVTLLTQTDFEKVGEGIANFIKEIDFADLLVEFLYLGATVIDAIWNTIKGLWKDGDALTRIGLVIAGLIGAAKIKTIALNLAGATITTTGTSTIASNLYSKISTACINYFGTNPLVVAVSVAVSWKLGESIGKQLGNEIFSAIADEDLSQYYKDFHWFGSGGFFDEISDDWEMTRQGWVSMIDDISTHLEESSLYQFFHKKEGKKITHFNHNEGGSSGKFGVSLDGASDSANRFGKAVQDGMTTAETATKKSTKNINKNLVNQSVSYKKGETSVQSMSNTAKQEFSNIDKYAKKYIQFKRGETNISSLDNKSKQAFTAINSYLAKTGMSVDEFARIYGIDMDNTSNNTKIAETNIKASTTGISGQFNHTHQSILGSMTKINSDVTSNFTTAQQNGTNQTNTLKNNTTNNFNTMSNNAKTPLNNFANNVLSYFKTATNNGTSQTNSLKDNSTNNLNTMANNSKTPLNNFKNWVNSYTKDANTTATNNTRNISSNVGNNMNGMANSSRNGLNNFLNTVRDYMNHTTNTIQSQQGAWSGVGHNLVAGLEGGLQDKWSGGLLKTVKNLAQQLTNKLKNVFGVHSPSREWAEVGEFLDLGLIEGLESKEQKVINSIANMGIRMSGTLQDSLSDDIQLPDIVQGKVIPTAMSYNIQTTNTQENIRDIIREELSNLNLSMPERIAVEMPDSRVLAEVVWDEEEKRYKQYGYA